MLQPERAYAETGAGYRYGFNGKEKDDEVKGAGNQLNYDARVYDPRVGRWLASDPLQTKYPDLSPYIFAGNCPIFLTDVDGRDITPTKAFLNSIQYKYYNQLITNNSVYQKLLSKYKGSKTFNVVFDANDKMILKGARANTAISQNTVGPIVSVNAKSYYSNVSGSTDKSVSYDNGPNGITTYTYHYDYTDISYIKTLLHEAVHLYIATITRDDASDLSHTEFAKYRDLIVKGLTEYLNANNLTTNLTNEELNIYAWQGVEKSRQFKAYIKDLAKRNNTTVEGEQEKYDKKIFSIEEKLVVVKKEVTNNNSSNSNKDSLKNQDK